MSEGMTDASPADAEALADGLAVELAAHDGGAVGSLPPSTWFMLTALPAAQSGVKLPAISFQL